MPPQQLQMRIEKMQSPDSDLRFMALNDLANDLAKNQLGNQDDQSEAKLTRQVVSLLADKNSEVKNQAVKCLGQLIKVVRPAQMDSTIDQLIEYSGGKDDELRDIAGLALKTVTAELPQDGAVAPRAIQKLVPKLLQQLSTDSTPPDALIETLATLTILVSRFPSHVPPKEPMAVLTPLLSHGRPAVRKRTISTIASFVPGLPDDETQEFIKSTILPGLASSGVSLDKQRTTVHLVASVARHLAPCLDDIVPGVLAGIAKDDAELREAGLQALELVTLRCPTETTPFLEDLIKVGTTYIKYDPNYAEDEDEPMEDADEDEDEDEDQDQYSDDEDTSYKIRRSATKLLAAVISTRPGILAELYSSVAPVLISRFADREPTVRYEVWSAFTVLLRQTRQFLADKSNYKYSDSNGDEDDERNYTPLEKAQELVATVTGLVPKILKSMLKTLSPKSAPPVQALVILNTLLSQLPQGSPRKYLFKDEHKTLEEFTEPLYKILVNPEALPTLLHLIPQALPPADVQAKLITLTHERHPRVAADALRAGIQILDQMGSEAAIDSNNEFANAIQKEARERLKNSSTDATVREYSAKVIGALLSGRFACDPEDWELVRRAGAVSVVKSVPIALAERNPNGRYEIAEEWLEANVAWCVELVKKGSSASKVEAMDCLKVLLHESGAAVSEEDQPTLIANLVPNLTTADPTLLVNSLSLLTYLLNQSPEEWFAPIEKQTLSKIYPLACETLLASSLDALLSFFYALASADEQIASHLVGGLKIAYERSGGEGVSKAGNVSKCLGAVVRAQRPIAAGTINEFAKHIKPTTKVSQGSLLLCLLTVGEIGRFIDMSNQPEVFEHSLGFFKSESEEIRTAAAFAVGNIAIGSQERFLPVIVKQVQSDDEKRLLSMHALKEVVSHCSQAHLETIAESLWQPLFDTGSTHENALNIAASCLGKLTTTNPARFLPPLEARLQDPSPTVRALVVSAMRHMFGFEGGRGELDELLKPFVVVFLGLLDDKDLNVKRLSLAALNQAARNKPRLIEDQLPALLPKLYDETTPKPELIRIMEMGPWRHKIDDGLEARRTAFETMYTLLDTSLSKLNLHEFLTIVLRGLSDESNEVKVLCHMMLHRLSQVAPSATAQRLDETVEPLQAAMKEPAVDKNTVKQDLEQAAELQRSALRAAAALNGVAGLSHGGAPKFAAFVEGLEKGKWAGEFREQRT